MRVLFVYPNWHTQLGINHGLASLSASLLAAGHETRLVNLNEELPPVPTDEEIFDLVREWRPGLVAFSCLSMQYAEGRRVARMLRERAREDGGELPPLVVGGVHPTMVPEEVMADGVWDHVGVGECEDALLELVASLERGEARDDLANFLSWRGGRRPPHAEDPPVDAARWVRNPVGPLPDLVRFPRPDYELFDVARILDEKDGWFSLMTGRGCPYRCTYCLNHRIVDRYREDLGVGVSAVGYCRYREPQQMVEEVRWILERFPGVRTFILDDDLFTLDAEHATAFARAYAEAGFEIPWVANAHVKRLEADLARELANGGCRILKLGVEAGSERVRRDILARRMTDEDIVETIATAEAHGLSTSGFLMVGIPGETHEERLETVDLVARSGLSRFRTALCFPFPGTDLFDQAVALGLMHEGPAHIPTDFTEESGIDYGEEENLFLEKLAACMPWFVNARMRATDGPVAADRYLPRVAEVLALDRPGWEELRPRIAELDAELSREATAAGELHYSIRFQAFMGVRSDRPDAVPSGAEVPELSRAPVPTADG